MREIKFRAWDKTNNLMLYDIESTTMFEITPERPHFYTMLHSGLFHVMQYTGLKDNNGKEIYEGDIVYLAGYGDYEVEFPFTELYEHYPEGDIGEIKGNIYENPDLINQ